MTAAPVVHRAERPYTWPPLRAVNAVADRVPRLRTSLDEEQLRDAARKATGLEDFGSREHEDGLRVLLAALEHEADLTPAGRWFARGHVISSLTNRLLVQRELEVRPAIIRQPVGPALVVLGLPRSGTTLLQNLLALDGDNRSLWQWEASHPVLPDGVAPGRPDPRVREAERATWLLDRIAPAARALHPTGPRLPTECVTLFANSFASLELGSIYQVPSYTRWCLSTDMEPHYAYYARQLQLLSARDRRERWVLKSPAHLFWIPELAQALPDATLVQVHRDPVQVLGSFCSLVAVLAATNTRRVDLQAIGRFWTERWAEGVARAELARHHLDPARMLDVRYDDLVARPLEVIADLYAARGLELRGEVVDAMREYLAHNPQHRRGTHAYSLESFGLSSQQVRERFEEVDRGRWR